MITRPIAMTSVARPRAATRGSCWSLEHDLQMMARNRRLEQRPQMRTRSAVRCCWRGLAVDEDDHRWLCRLKAGVPGPRPIHDFRNNWRRTAAPFLTHDQRQ